MEVSGLRPPWGSWRFEILRFGGSRPVWGNFWISRLNAQRRPHAVRILFACSSFGRLREVGVHLGFFRVELFGGVMCGGVVPYGDLRAPWDARRFSISVCEVYRFVWLFPKYDAVIRGSYFFFRNSRKDRVKPAFVDLVLQFLSRSFDVAVFLVQFLWRSFSVANSLLQFRCCSFLRAAQPAQPSPAQPSLASPAQPGRILGAVSLAQPSPASPAQPSPAQPAQPRAAQLSTAAQPYSMSR